jgi:hypothetical protein
VPASPARTQELRSRAKNSTTTSASHTEATDFFHEGCLFAAIATPFIEEKEIEEFSRNWKLFHRSAFLNPVVRRLT